MTTSRVTSRSLTGIRAIVFALAVLWLCPAALANKRLALVIGNDNYLSVSVLKNARNDARLMASALREASFDVTEVNDLDLRRMWRAIETFQARIGKGDEVVFFFAGHGVQIGSEPVLLPVDIVAESDGQVLREAVALSKIQDAFKDARLALLIIDACRDNPFPPRGTRTVGGARGLPTIEAADGAAIIMSASRGQKAMDSVPGLTTENGLFTFEFVRAIRVPGADLRVALQDVRERVEDRAKRSGAQQRPAIVDETRGNFYFFPAQVRPGANAIAAIPAPAIPAPATAAATEQRAPRLQTAEEAEQEYWNLVRESKDVRDFTDYLSRYPSGRFAAMASRQQRLLQPASAQTTPPASPVPQAPTASTAPAAVNQRPVAAASASLQAVASGNNAAPAVIKAPDKPAAVTPPVVTAPAVAAAAVFQNGTLVMQGARFVGRYIQEGPTRSLSGEGEMRWDNGDVYKGRLTRGERVGAGEMIWANGQSYRGDWVADAPVGQGTLKFANGDVYEGSVSQGLPNGRGRMSYASGDRYEGSFERGKAQGAGVYAWKNGQRYDGQWQGDVPQGEGRLSFANGNVYEGTVVNGIPQGRGTMTYSTGDTYAGNFLDGKHHGNGQYKWTNGDQYVGLWQAGFKHGQGTLTWATGDRWQGEYRDDQQTERGALVRKTP